MKGPDEANTSSDLVAKAKEVPDKPYMAFNEGLLKALGVWPGEGELVTGRNGRLPDLRLLFTAIMYIVAMISCVNQVRLTPQDIPTLTQCLSVMGTFLVAAHKLSALHRHKRVFARLLAEARAPFSFADEMPETVSHLKALDRVQFVYSVSLLASCAVTVIFMIMRPPLQVLFLQDSLTGSTDNSTDILFNNDPLLPLKISVPMPAGADQTRWVYVLLYIYHSVLASYHIFCVPALDGFYAGLMLRAASRLRMLRAAFQRLREDAKAKAKEAGDEYQREEVWLQRTFAQRVREHQNILIYIQKLEKVLSSVMMSQFFMSSALLPCAAYQIVSFPGDVISLTSNAAYFSGGLMQLGAYCVFGDSVKQESDAVGMSAYCSDWVGSGRAHISSVRIVLMRSLSPARLTIGRFAELSLETYAAILKGCFTYFTLLNELTD